MVYVTKLFLTETLSTMASAVQLKRKSLLKREVYLNLSTTNLLGGSVCSVEGIGLIAIPNNSSVELHKWPHESSNESIPLSIISLEEESKQIFPLLVSWGNPHVCPSFLALGSHSSVRVFQCQVLHDKVSTMLISNIPIIEKPLSLSWHPKRCVLAVFDKNGVSLFDLSSPAKKGAVLEKKINFSVPNSLKCGSWGGCRYIPKNSKEQVKESDHLEAELALAGSSELNVFVLDNSINQCHKCLSGTNNGVGGNFRTLTPCLGCIDSEESTRYGRVFVGSFDAEELVKTIAQDFGPINAKPRSLNCVFNNSVSMSRKSMVSLSTTRKVEQVDHSGNLGEGGGGGKVVDLRGCFDDSKSSSVSKLLAGVGSNTSNTPSSSHGVFSDLTENKSQSKISSRIGVFGMEKKRLVNVANVDLPQDITTPNVVSVLPPCGDFGGLVAVAGESSICLLSLKKNSHERSFADLKVIAHMRSPLKPRGLKWGTCPHCHKHQTATLFVLYAKRCIGQDGKVPPTILTSSNLVPMETFIYTYECSLSYDKNIDEKNMKSIKKKSSEETEEGSAREKTKLEVRQSILSMMTSDPSSFFHDDDGIIGKEVEGFVDQIIDSKTRHFETKGLAEEVMPASKTPEIPMFQNKSSKPLVVSSQQNNFTSQPISSEPTIDVSSALVTLSLAMGRMEERMVGKLDRVLSVVETNSERIMRLEHQLEMREKDERIKILEQTLGTASKKT